MTKTFSRDRRIIIFILTDPTLVSINHIQQAHKQADNGFNDVIAELYDLEFRKQEILKQDRIKEAKEKAIEEERIIKKQDEDRRQDELARVSESNRKRAESEALERAKEIARTNNKNTQSQPNETSQPTQSSTSSIIGSNWAEVSPEQASQYMSARTGVSASKWASIIYAESTNNPTVTNSIGCFGYLQLHPVHGNVSSMSPQQYLDTAVGVYNSQGLSAWEVVTMGMVN